jgi:uncharacterized membrane protein
VSDTQSLDNVLVVTFEDDSKADDALGAVTDLDKQGKLSLEGAAVVTRNADGRVTEKHEVGDPDAYAVAGGTGLVGLIVGVLGGPLGVLVGGATGVLLGSLFDEDDDDETRSVLTEISTSVAESHTALLAQVTEHGPEAVDSTMAQLGGSVLRRPVEDVEAELADAEEAQSEAKRAARERLRKARHEKEQSEVKAKVAELQRKLGHNGHAAAHS